MTIPIQARSRWRRTRRWVLTGNTLTIASSISDPTPLPVPTPRLRKADLGTVVLQNADAYSGKTVVDQGVLRFQNPLSLGTTRNEVQTISNFLSSGTYTLTFNGATTAPLQANATTAQVQAALNGLPSISGVGGTVTVVGTYTGRYGLHRDLRRNACESESAPDGQHRGRRHHDAGDLVCFGSADGPGHRYGWSVHADL
ncbi:MAG: hypothetical protein U0798_08580 [Gemmataceae bacterium]